MNWQALKSNSCPACGEKLVSKGLLDPLYVCSSKSCEFCIGHDRFDEIIADMYRVRAKPVADNLSALNNLGRKVVSEDFADSPFADRK